MWFMIGEVLAVLASGHNHQNNHVLFWKISHIAIKIVPMSQSCMKKMFYNACRRIDAEAVDTEISTW